MILIQGQTEDQQDKEEKRPWKPPNHLEWDDAEREKELNLMQRMMELCDKMHSLASVSVVDADVVSAKLVKSETKRDALVAHVLKLEEDITDSAVLAEEQYVSKFKLHAAGKANSSNSPNSSNNYFKNRNSFRCFS
jgi:hypothetical protein